MKKLLLLAVLAFALALPTMAQTAEPFFQLDIDNDPLTAIPGPDYVIELGNHDANGFTNVNLFAHVGMPGMEGYQLQAKQVSFHYWIWRNDDQPAKGKFVVDHIFQPNDGFVISQWFEWADIATNKPYCTYFKVQADITFEIIENGDPMTFSLVSNELTFHVDVPEPGSLLAFGTGLTGLIGFAVRRRRM